MKIILKKPIKNLGTIGDICDVKNGFGRYLIRFNNAIYASKENISLLNKQKEELSKQKLEIEKKIDQLLSLFANKELVFIRSSAEDKKLFGSISKKDILNKLLIMIENNKDLSDVNLKSDNIILQNKIKEIGIYKVMLSFQNKKSVTILVNVARSKDESTNMMDKFIKKQEDVNNIEKKSINNNIKK